MNLSVAAILVSIRPEVTVARTAERLSEVKRNMPLLWTFYDHPETSLPNTNNALEGLFSDLISREHREKLLDEYIRRHY